MEMIFYFFTPTFNASTNSINYNSIYILDIVVFLFSSNVSVFFLVQKVIICPLECCNNYAVGSSDFTLAYLQFNIQRVNRKILSECKLENIAHLKIKNF